MLSKEEIKAREQLVELLKTAISVDNNNVTLKLDKLACKTLYAYIEQLETDKQKLIKYLEKKMCEYDDTIIEIVLQNVLAVAKGEKC